VCQGASPDLTFFLEISPEESIFRRKNEIPDRIESEGIRFLEKKFKIIEDFFERLFEIQPHQFGCTLLNLHGIETLSANYLIH